MSRPGMLENGTVIGADFRVVRPLGEGGMGAVYVVEQLSTGSQRALKVMHEHLVRDDKLRGRFVQEARIGARIRSDHVVQVIAAGIQEESGAPWLVMELLDGRDLASHVKAHGPLSVGDAREVCAQLCHALAAAHQVGVVHRDLKPENVFLAESRREGTPFTVKVLDFGIAKLLSEALPSTTTAAIGTPLWMAPEQSDINATIGAGTDVWALGLMVFWMLTGRFYWRAANAQEPSTMALMREVIFEPLPSAGARAAELGVAERLPPGFEDWFARCVIREPLLRYRDAGEARPALLALLGGEAIPAAAQGAHDPSGPTAGSGSGPLPRPLIAITPPGPAPQVDIVTAPTQLMTGPAAEPSRTGPAVSESLPPPEVEIPRRKIATAWLLGGLAAVVVVAAAGLASRRGGTEKAKQAQCEKGMARACAELAHEQENLRTGRAMERALQHYERACELGHWPSCSRLGALLQTGEGVTRDDARAAKAYDKACTGGEASACRTLATMHLSGEGVGKSASQAAVLLVRACDLGLAEGCTKAGEMFRDGVGAVPDPDRARELFARGCFGRDKRACDEQRRLEAK